MRFLNPLALTHLMGGNFIMHTLLIVNATYLLYRKYQEGVFEKEGLISFSFGPIHQQRQNYNDVIYMIIAHFCCILFMTSHWISRWYKAKYMRETSMVAQFFTYMCFIIYAQ